MQIQSKWISPSLSDSWARGWISTWRVLTNHVDSSDLNVGYSVQNRKRKTKNVLKVDHWRKAFLPLLIFLEWSLHVYQWCSLLVQEAAQNPLSTVQPTCQLWKWMWSQLLRLFLASQRALQFPATMQRLFPYRFSRLHLIHPPGKEDQCLNLSNYTRPPWHRLTMCILQMGPIIKIKWSFPLLFSDSPFCLEPSKRLWLENDHLTSHLEMGG